MKKILNISVIAALAILPMAANAAPVAGDPTALGDNPPGGQTAQNVTAGTAPKYQLAEANEAVDGVVATAGYVKGAYNAAIKAINKVSDTANSAVKGVQVNGEDLSLTGGIANVTITEGTADGTVKVNGTDINVHGLGTAAYTNSNAYDAAGTAAGVQTAIEGKLDDGANGYDIDAKTLKVAGQDVLTNAALTDYATKTGVTTTVTNAFTGATATLTNSNVTKSAVEGTATISVVDTWGATAPAATGVSVDLTNTSVVQGLTGTATVTAGTIAYPTNP